MTTYTEALEPTKSSKRRTVRWTPHPAEAGCACCGDLTIDTDRERVEYHLTELPVGRGFGAGRAVALVKADRSEVYAVFVSEDGIHHQCDCAGFAYGRGKPCKHIDGVAALIANGWLPDPRANAEQDTGPTEVEDQPLPACFAGVGHGPSDRVPF